MAVAPRITPSLQFDDDLLMAMNNMNEADLPSMMIGGGGICTVGGAFDRQESTDSLNEIAQFIYNDHRNGSRLDVIPPPSSTDQDNFYKENDAFDNALIAVAAANFEKHLHELQPATKKTTIAVALDNEEFIDNITDFVDDDERIVPVYGQQQSPAATHVLYPGIRKPISIENIKREEMIVVDDQQQIDILTTNDVQQRHRSRYSSMSSSIYTPDDTLMSGDVSPSPMTMMTTKARKYRRKDEDEKHCDQYKVKRARNNDAVRRSRLKAKDRQMQIESHAERLEDENKKLRAANKRQQLEIIRLRKELDDMKQQYSTNLSVNGGKKMTIGGGRTRRL